MNVFGVSSTLKVVLTQWLSFPVKRTICYLSANYCSPLANNDIRVNQIEDTTLLGSQPIRNRVKQYFARPSEIKRIRRHGWKARMATHGGRRIIMRRILKGRHVLTH